MFSFCFFHSSSSSSADVEAKDVQGQKRQNVTTCPTDHDLSSLLYTPIEGLEIGSVFLTLMASPLSTINNPLSPSSSSSQIKQKMMTNSSSSSSLVTHGPNQGVNQFREKYKFEQESAKSSYNVSTLNRIILLESVTRQTMSLSIKSQSALQKHLLNLKPLRDVQSKFEQLNRRVGQLKRLLETSRQKLNHDKDERIKIKSLVNDRRDEMEERVQLLRSMITLLNGKRSELDQKKVELYHGRHDLEVKRAEVSSLNQLIIK